MNITFDCYENVRAVHFPPGLPEDGGSCEFTTKRCREECNYKINSFEKQVFADMTHEREIDLKVKIRYELDRFNCRILSWFATGDCPKSMTDKITSIMDWLSEEGYIQCGFTRNQQLWANILTMNNVRLGLTVEDHEKAEKLSKRGLVSVPNYDEWTTDIYVKGSRIFNCGGGFGTTCGEGYVIEDAPIEKVYSEDCGHCYKGNRGCFTNEN